MFGKDPCIKARSPNLRSKIDLVSGDSNAWAELSSNIPRLTSEMLLHFLNRYRSDTKFRPLLARMNNPAGASFRVRQIQGPAIRHINANDEARGSCHNTVCSRNREVWSLFDYGHLISMHLLGNTHGSLLKAHLSGVLVMPIP
ncbi:hypothetical protein SAMN02745166_01741 [Prosthecobacter debontii]|uniref:Uncharacterized protein n=1 Tax=Prosthecobacter debontii TaxID=48467 RepID=A0A1T4XMG2_9BACT|nr:hypothetical protein SAMN02745166_01741 [Prosthecobacter debontii]